MSALHTSHQPHVSPSVTVIHGSSNEPGTSGSAAACQAEAADCRPGNAALQTDETKN